MLRERYGFDGVVCADWGLLTDSHIFGKVLEARAWGVEHLSLEERARKAIEAGIDQFGGEECPEVIVALVESGAGGRVPDRRVGPAVAAGQVSAWAFRSAGCRSGRGANAIVGKAEFRAAGEGAQRRSVVLLTNRTDRWAPALPALTGKRLFIENIAPEVAGRYGEIVADVADADLAILRLAAPFEPRDNRPLEAFFHAGDLAFPDAELARILRILETVPTVVDIYLDRPAVIPEIAANAAALLGTFGVSDDVLLDAFSARFAPTGKLPFELPSSMEAVRAQLPDVPFDSADPVFPFGHGLGY